MEKKNTNLNKNIIRVSPNNSISNKSRTNLLVLVNEDLKNIMKNCRTTINSRNLNEFVKEFDSVVVNLAKETFSSSRNVNLGHDQISKASIKSSVPITISNKKDFDYRKKRFSVSEKKLEFFNKKLKESMEGNLKSNYSTTQNEDDGLQATNIEQRKSGSKNSDSRRKFSLIRLKDKLKEEIENKQNKKYEKAVEGFDYLQSICLAFKNENSLIEIEEENEYQYRNNFTKNHIEIKHRQSAKSCDKKNIKMLSELMKNLQGNLNENDAEKIKSKIKNSGKFHKLNSLTRKRTDQNINYNKKYKLDIKNDFSNYKITEVDYNLIQKLESSDAESSKSRKDNASSCNNYLHNSANTLRSVSYVSSLESKNILRVNSIEENLYEKDFKINVNRCSFSSLADQERDMDYFYGSSGYTPKSFKDFNIQLKNCRRSKDEYDSISRKMSEITPPSSVNEDGYEY